MTYLQQHARSIAEPAAFWAEQARSLAWYQAPANILESLPDGTHRWFADGRLNSAYLALDRQIEEGRGEQTALIYDSLLYTSLRVVGESFGRLQKELAWKGETRCQGKHDKQLDRQP